MTANGPLVSVFIPTYNQQQYIGAAIDSALAQDYEPIEVVVGDDCSSDRTWAVVLECQRAFPRKIRAFRNERNLGITGNCKTLLRQCSGKYIAFHAGDDLFLPGKIRKQVAVLEKDESIVICYHDIEVFNSETNATIRFWNHGPSSTPPVVGSAHEVARAVVATCNCVMSGLSVMARMAALPPSGYDERVPVASDWLLWIELLSRAGPGAKVAFLDEVLARYRVHSANVTNSLDNYYSNILTTLALAESNYPWLIDDVARCQAQQRYINGVRLIRNGDCALGRKYLIQSARVHFLSWKWFGWIAASYVPAMRGIETRFGGR